MPLKQSKELQNSICEEYINGKNSIEILLKKYNISPASLYRLLKKNNISKRLYHSPHKNKLEVNENYFENIDTENKAYWLGFISTNGYIYDHSENFKRLQIILPIKDLYHLEKFKNEINSENKITISKNYCKLSINRIKLCKDLEKWNNISLIPDNLIYHYFRGIIDYDGFFSIQNNQIKFTFVSSDFLFIQEFKNYLENKLNLLSVSIYKERNVYYIQYINNDKILKIFNYLYNQSNTKLEYKYELYKSFINLY